MRFTITLSGQTETGEGRIAKGSTDKIKFLIFEHPLLAADLLKDWIFDLEQLYDEAVVQMQKDFENTRNPQ